MNYHDLEDCEKIQTYSVVSMPTQWIQFDRAKYQNINDKNTWRHFKFIAENGEFSDGMRRKDRCKGGVYVFYINPEIIPDIHVGIMYIGRAKNTSTQGLYKRMREYYRDYILNNNGATRNRSVNKIFRHWSKYLYVKYVIIDDNNLIDEFENVLIETIRPPFNERKPKTKLLPIKIGEEVFK